VPAVAVSGVIAFAYWGWVEICYARNGFYPYPLFEMLSTAERVALFGGSAALMAAATVGCKRAYGWVNGLGGDGKGVKGPVRQGERPGMVKGSL